MEDGTFKFSNLSKFQGIVHGISKRNYGQMKFGKGKTEEVIKNREHFFKELGIEIKNVAVANMSHSEKISVIGRQEAGRGSRDQKSAIPMCDGLITAEKEISLMITVADCLPILVYDPALNIVSIIHAGWRGILAGIIPNLISKLKNMGSFPDDLIVGIGPSICQKHFVVKKDVLEKFKDKYPSATFVRNHDGYVDLKRAAFEDLIKHNILKNNIEISHDCPVCNPGIYGSYRLERDKTIF